VGVKIGNAYADAAFAAVAAYDAEQALEKANNELNKMEELYKQGKASKDAVEDAKVNVAMATANLANAAISLAASIAGAATAASSSYGTGMYAAGFANYDTQKQSSSAESLFATQGNIISNGNITFKSGNDMVQEGTNVYATKGTLTYDITNDLTIKASKDTYSQENKSEHLSGGVSVGNNAVQVSASAGASSSRAKATTYANSESAAQNIVMKVGGDATLSGANVNATNELTATIGGNLTVESLQDTYYSKGNSWDASLSVGGGSVGGGFNVGNDYTDSAWVNEQTSLTSGNKANITVGGKTTLTGAVIASEKNDLTLKTKELEYNDLEDRNVSRATGFGLSTSIGVSKEGLSASGATTLTLKNTGNEKEQINRATIGEGSIIIDGKEATNEQLSGLNRDVSKSQEVTSDKITGALDASMTLDNRLFTETGRESIANDFENIGTNLKQIGKGLTNNIVTQSIKNAVTDKETNIIEAVKDYMGIDRTETEIQQDKELTGNLNGLTNQDAEGVRDTLQEVADKAGKDGGFSGDLELYNEGIENRGYAYQDNDGGNKTIGINTKATDLTNSGEVIKNIFHETTPFAAHNDNEQTAINRGNTAEAIWELKNFGNENTNKITNAQWNENNAGSAVFKTGNANVKTNVSSNNGNMLAYGGLIVPTKILPTTIGNNQGMTVLITQPPQRNPEDYIEVIPKQEEEAHTYITQPKERTPEDFVETIPTTDPGPTVLADPKPEKNADDYILKSSDKEGTNKDEKNIDSKVKSTNQIQKDVEKGNAPKSVERVDKGNADMGEQDHIHFRDGDNNVALNKDGTWKHKPNDSFKLSNKDKEWIKKNGWTLPE
jgi:filamentous hemagglutinin